LIEGDFKLVTSVNKRQKEALYNIVEDKAESINVIADHAAMAGDMQDKINAFLKSAQKSHSGADYGSAAYLPADPWPVD